MITEQLTDEIASRLENNLPVRTHLPGGGRVHIDRQLPFLILVYMAMAKQITKTLNKNNSLLRIRTV